MVSDDQIKDCARIFYGSAATEQEIRFGQMVAKVADLEASSALSSALKASEALCNVYFEIASAYLGEDVVRRIFDARLAEMIRIPAVEESFWCGMFLRARCGCLAKDCVRHGAYDPAKVDRVMSAVSAAEESGG